MRRLADIDLLGDAAMQQEMVASSMAILALGTALGVTAGMLLPHEQLGIGWFVLLAAVSVAALPVHELVHALFFKLMSGMRAHVKFGFSSWMLYTAAPGCMLPRGRFCVVLLSPSVLVTGALLAVPAALGMPLLGWYLAVIHLAGCTGDIAYARIIARETHAQLVEDTERGIALFSDS